MKRKNMEVFIDDNNDNFELTLNPHIQENVHYGNKKSNTEEFKIKGRKKHGNKYDYSNVMYINNQIKVKITFNDCNYNFEQRPNNHLMGYGCKICGGTLQLTTEDFKKRCKEKHGNKYDYSNVVYINSQTKVKITCNDCNYNFEQIPHGHLSGQGCPQCGGRLQLTTEEFKKRGKEKHGDKFDYKQSIYKNTDTKLKIGCNKCNEIFEQTPNNHLHGSGCSKCIIFKGEEQIQKVLKKLLINFEKHKRLKMGDSNLELDFYFLNNIIQNIGIERDGEQHFFPKGFGCKDKQKIQENFEGVQKRDKIKNEWCKENNYHLLRISFMTPLEEYENLIIEFLQESEQHKGQPFIKYDFYYKQLLDPNYNSDDDILVN